MIGEQVDGSWIQHYFNSGHLLSAAEEQDLGAQMEHGGAEAKQAREQFILSNLPLVFIVAYRYAGRSQSLEDLVHEGILGLIRAVDKFDYRLGFKFSTYACIWIESFIRRAAAPQRKTISLYANYSDDPGDDLLVDSIADDNSIPPDDEVINSMLQTQIRAVLNTITPQEKEILELRFGIRDGEEHTLEDVGSHFGVSRERIRIIEARALRKLRHPSRSRQFRGYFR